MKKISLPCLSLEKIQVLNTTFSKKHRLEFTLMGGRWHVSFLPTSRLGQTGCTLVLTVNTFDFRIRLDKQLFAFSDRKLMDIPWSALPEELLPAIVEAGLLDAVRQFEQDTGYYCSLKDLQLGDDAGVQETDITLPFVLRDDKGGVLAGEVDIPANGAGFFTGLIASLPVINARECSSLVLTLSFRVGSNTYSLREIRDMAPGDVYFFNGDETGCPAEVVTTNFSIFSGFFDRVNNRISVQRMEKKMDGDDRAGVTEESDVIGELDDIEVPLVFEVGRKRMSIRELKEIQPGYVFELSSSANRPVAVQTSGKTIAYGELVDIEGRTGVRILEVGKDGSI